MKAVGASIAHELRTPIRSILSGTHGLEKFLPDVFKGYELAQKNGLPIENPIYPTQLKLLKETLIRLEHEANSANTIVDMLLMKLRDVDDPELYSRFEVIDMASCIEEALKRYPFQEHEKNMISYELENNFKFKGNSLFVEHIIFNLMKNAIYYVAAANKDEKTSIRIWLTRGKSFNEIHFKDTGTGIDPAILPKIFDRFFTKTTHGTGIGLAFCKMAAEYMRGKITCDSIYGEFTEFVISFPVLKN